MSDTNFAATRPTISLDGVRALFVSPHFDDVALSCGGTAARTTASDEPSVIVTVFAGEPSTDSSLSDFARFQHERWGTLDETVLARRREDAEAAATLGASSLWLPYHDAIYRGDQYLSDEDLFGVVKSGDADLVEQLSGDLQALWRQTCAQPENRATVYLPLGVGNHVDHQLCFLAGKALHRTGASVAFYEDFPYGADPGSLERRLAAIDMSLAPVTVDVTEFIEKRLAAIAAYRSQLAVIFRHYGPFEEVTRAWAAKVAPGTGGYGERFWRPA